MEQNTKHTVLMIEDDMSMGLALGNALENEGYVVIRAADGEDGLNTAIEKHPDIILLDLKLPKLSGMDMLQRLRSDPWGKHARVIILTNVSDLTMLQTAMAHGAFYYMVKSDSSVKDIIRNVKEQLLVPESKEKKEEQQTQQAA